MPVIKYWDIVANQYLPCAIGPPGPQGPPGSAVSAGCVPVQATAPPTDGTAVVPPEGYLWIDTSTSVAIPPYTPPQTPPPTGFNSYTDTAGTAWISQNGGTWQQARNSLMCRYFQTAGFNVPTSAGGLSLDTRSFDQFSMYNAGVFTCPLGGMYRLTFQVTATALAAGNQLQAQLNLPIRAIFSSIAGGSATFSASASTLVPLTAGQTAATYMVANVSLAGVVGTQATFFEAIYMGTG